MRAAVVVVTVVVVFLSVLLVEFLGITNDLCNDGGNIIVLVMEEVSSAGVLM